MPQEMKWCYYKHAIVPATAPHETADEDPLKSGSLWKAVGGHPLFARWTSDFDCGTPTDWWYIIKDTPFLLTDVKASYRYKINKGLKHFEVQIVNPVEYAEALYRLQLEAFSGYPAKYRPAIDHENFITGLRKRSRKGTTFAAFSKDDGSIAGYIYTETLGNCVMLSVQRSNPSYEKLQVNAALLYGLLSHFHAELTEGMYITDGERSVVHETNFHDYLEKYFHFRKAYCKLHILYRPGIQCIVAALYPFRGLFKRCNRIFLLNQIYSVLSMEEIIRKQKHSDLTKVD